jgi:hypothetical protein
MDYSEQNNYPKAFLATGIILVVVAALCWFIVFKNPAVETDGNGGILVNYGTTDEGSGKDYLSTEQPSQAEKANHTQPDKVREQQPTEQKTQVDNSPEKVVTQETEDAAAVANETKKTKTQQVVTEPVKPVKKEVVNQNALYKGSTNKGTGAGDGTTSTAGNQGSPTGSTLTTNYGKGGSGKGVGGSQWGYVSQPQFNNPNRTPGRVVVDVTIDTDGNIIEAHADRATRMSDLELINRCIEILKNTKLKALGPVSGVQQVAIPITFDIE